MPFFASRINRRARVIAAFLLVSLLNQFFAPTVALALTAGPTSPEATSFEPIDTTDMVNLQTGDFTYNMPLLEVPGPEGGYPLALSYHAGIQPEEEASWVGLGWSLNPGAITRNVNGYPDDWYTPTQTSRDYWSGGVQKTYSVGLSVGLPGPVGNVSGNLAFSQDTYRGFGVGLSAGVGVGIGGKESPLNAGVSIGISPYGDPFVSGGLGVSTSPNGLGATVGIQVSTNFESLSAGASGGVSYGVSNSGGTMNYSLLGASISTNGEKPSFEIGGLTSSVANNNAGRIQTKTQGFSFGVPIWYGVNLQLGYSKVRYWSDETAVVNTHGSLHSSGWSVTDNVAYDTYSLLDDPEQKNIVDFPDPTKVQGGAYMDYDTYSVNAQGLAGNMRPHLFQGEVLSQNRKIYSGSSATATVNYFSPGVTHSQPKFRFINDFSNSYRQSYPVNPNPSLNLTAIEPTFDQSPAYGNNDGNYGYAGSNDLAGSRYIKVHELSSTMEIGPRNAAGYDPNFVKTISNPTNSANINTSRSRMIKGYSITNESGVTYHFSLPAYAWNEEVYQEKITTNTNDLSFNRLKRPEPYAYTWHLTAITGPDYVDRNNNRIVDDQDWGYWVSFEYGRWSSTYNWRNPGSGYHRDEDNQFKIASMGTKQVYYLNAIRTRSHIALFEKNIRFDAKGGSKFNYNKQMQNGKETRYLTPGVFDATSVQSMMLSKVYLMNAADSAVVSTSSGGDVSNRTYSPCTDCEHTQNVLDATDISAMGKSNIEAKALRVIDFNYDYSLCKDTKNSYDTNGSSLKSGKLSLKEFVMRGKGGANYIPPTQFEYDLSSDESNSSAGVFSNNSVIINGAQRFNRGDLIVTDDDDGIYCGYISDISVSGQGYRYAFKNGNAAYISGSRQVKKTKNPSYRENSADIWGSFKSDINGSTVDINPNLGKQTSELSAKNVDAWSLRRIKPPLGNEISIDYESDSYRSSVLNKNYSLIMNNLTRTGDHTLTFQIDPQGYEVSEFVAQGKKYRALLVMKCDIGAFIGNTYIYLPTQYCVPPTDLTITQVNGNTVTATTVASLTPTGGDVKNIGLVTGNISFEATGKVVYGGGVRVASVSASNGEGNLMTTSYNYKSPSDNIASGVTSYTPTLLPFFEKDKIITTRQKEYQKNLYKDMHSLISIARELPPPGVFYEYVTVSNEVKNQAEGQARSVDGKTMYQFEIFRENMIGRVLLGDASSGANNIRNVALKKFLTSIGNMKRTIKYDDKGNKITENVNHYLHDGLETLPLAQFMSEYETRLSRYFYQGLLKERTSEVKNVRNDNNGSYSTYSTFSGLDTYPCIQTGQTVVNYINGTRAGNEIIGFDFYSGAVTKSLETDSYGNRILTETVPAYRKYAHLGLKSFDSSYKNMLIQTAGVTIYKVNAENQPLSVIAAKADVWSNTASSLDAGGNSNVQNNYSSGNVWRKQSEYQWSDVSKSTDGLTPINQFTAFNWSGTSAQNWKKISEVSLYNVFSKALEVKDINQLYHSSHLGYKNSKTVLQGGPAKYYEIAFSGAEDEQIYQTGIGLVRKEQGTVVIGSGTSHTGEKSLRVGAGGNKGMVYQVNSSALTSGRDYYAAVWVKGVNSASSDVKLYYQVNNSMKQQSISSSSSLKKAGEWTLIQLKVNGSDITGSANDLITIGCRNDHASLDAYLDDFRFQPIGASSIAYIYDSFSGELTYQLDNSNLYKHFEYDQVGRLTKTYQEKMGVNGGRKLAIEHLYNYSKSLSVGTKLVYARVEYTNIDLVESGIPYTMDYYLRKSADIYIRFYSDPMCLTLATLAAPMPIRVLTYKNFNGYAYDEYFKVTADSDVSELYLGRLDLEYGYSEEDRDGRVNTIWDTLEYSLVPSIDGSTAITYYPVATKM